MRHFLFLLVLLFVLPGCTFRDANMGQQSAAQIASISNFQYIVFSIFLGILVLSAVSAIAQSWAGKKIEEHRSNLCIAAVATIVVLVLCA